MNMNTSIIRLMYAFIGLFLVISLVMVNVQVFDGSWIVPKGLQAQSGYDPRLRFASEQPIRGSIYDRNGVKLVWSVRDDNAPCGWRRAWNPDAVNAGLAPLIGYFNCNYGASGVEAAYNAILTGSTGQNDQSQSARQTATNIYNHLLHKQVQGSDIYLTIDLKLQEQANALYNDPNNIYGGVCQALGADPAGSITIEDPNTGNILAMVSRPYYDPNRIDDQTYWDQLNGDPNHPLLNRAAQGLYDPGSTFKTVTMAAGIDSGKYQLSSPFTLDQDTGQDQASNNGGDQDQDQDQDQALYFTVPGGETVTWDDYFPRAGSGGWVGIASPVTLQDGYAYSDNAMFARVAYETGSDTWLSYVRRFGIATPGTPVDPVAFDGAFAQSRAYNPGADFNGDLLAESGFGQGQLLITPLTMAEVTSAMAANGNLYAPHVLMETHAPNGDTTQSTPYLYSGQPVVQPSTAAAVRTAMRAVVAYGTIGKTSTGPANLPIQEGGKTGTGQTNAPLPHTWWMSMAPASPDTNGQLVIVVMKEQSGEGACQFATADDLYTCAAADNDWTPPAALGACPVGVKPQG